MKILYDHQAFQMQNFGGISRYFIEIIQHINNTEDFTAQLALKYTDNEYLNKETWQLSSLKENQGFIKPLPEFNTNSILGKTSKAFNRLKPTLANKKNATLLLERGSFNVFHPTYYSPYFLSNLKGKPFVLTVHDMTHELYPKLFKFYDWTSSYKKKLVDKAHSIIAVSNNTKKDLIRLFNVSPEKIQVIPLANSITPTGLINNIANNSFLKALPTNYMLYVGKRDAYKNFTGFIEAIYPILNKEGIHLVCVGKPFSKGEQELLQSKNLLNKSQSLKVTDEELLLLYQNAATFVFPSFYEGFGLPILEAFAAKCPVIASNNSSLPEVGGTAALYFNPNDIEEMRFKIQSLLDNEQLKKELVKKGTQRLQLFSWGQTAKQTMEIYQKIA